MIPRPETASILPSTAGPVNTPELMDRLPPRQVLTHPTSVTRLTHASTQTWITETTPPAAWADMVRPKALTAALMAALA